MDTIKLEIRNLTKVYPGTIALQDFSADFLGGNVYALLGKNGSGKSTLVRCISGAILPTKGRMLLNGRPLQPRSPIDGIASGIASVYQELSLVPDLTVAENILLGRYAKRSPRGPVIDWKRTNQKAMEILQSLHIEIPVEASVRSLSLGQQQMVEIAKAMSYRPSVLILDEPTSALAQNEVESLFELVRKLKTRGVAVIYITHRLQELPAIADYVTVVRDGFNVGTISIDEAEPKRIVEMICGEARHVARPAGFETSSRVTLEVRRLSRGRAFSDVSFRLHEGEILGLAGMLGSGRSELLRSIFGADGFDRGEIIINGAVLRKSDIITMKKMGLAMTPENRKEEGLVQVLSIRENLCLASMDRLSSHGLLTPGMEKPFVDGQIANLQIKLTSVERPVSSLSGGNQQKVVIGNWLGTKPRVIFFDEPTRGIDVQAKQQIFNIVWQLSREGMSVVFVSTELEELFEVCHRILIMRQGRIVQETRPGQTSLDQLYSLCMGA